MKKMLTLLATISMMSCFGLHAQAKTLNKRITHFFKGGEYLRFRAKIGQVDGGHSYLVVKKVKGKGKGMTVRAVMKARTNTFFDKIHRVNNRFESEFSVNGFNKLKYRMDVDQAGTVQRRFLSLTAGRARKALLSLFVKPKSKKTKRWMKPWKRTYKVPKNTKDLVGAIYYARTLPYTKGKVFKMYVFVTGRLWKVKGKMLKRERIYTPFGYKNTLVIGATGWRLGVAGKAQKMKVWLSDDRYRLPLKMQGSVPYIGVASAILVGYRRKYGSRYMKNRRKSVRRFFSKF